MLVDGQRPLEKSQRLGKFALRPVHATDIAEIPGRPTGLRADLYIDGQIEVAVRDAQVDQVLEAIRDVANTGAIGDGKLFVVDLEQTVRIRTGETGDDAI